MKHNFYLISALFSIIFISGCANQSGETFVIPLSSGSQLGDLCTGNEECRDFCRTYSLECEEYCRNHHENPTCQEHFSFVLDDILDPTLAPGYAKCYLMPGSHRTYRTGRTFAIDKINPSTMYITVEYKGLYKSTDGGKSWQYSSNGIRGSRREDDQNKPCHGEYFSLYMDPTNSKRLLLLGGAGPGLLTETYGVGGIYETINGGESWSQLAQDWMSSYAGFSVIDPLNPATIYYTTSALTGSNTEADPNRIFITDGVVYKTADNGKTWEELPTGFVPHLRTSGLFMNPKDSNNLILTTFAFKGGNDPDRVLEPVQLGILFTKDGGNTWSQMTSLPEQYRAVGTADISSNNFDHMFVTTSGVPGIEGKSFYSLDGGETFAETSMAIAFAQYDPRDDSGMRLVGYMSFPFEEAGENIMESTDGGATWHNLGPWPQEMKDETVPIPITVEGTQKVRLSNIVFNPVDTKTIYLTGNWGYVWKSTDNGKTWTTILSVDMLEE